MSNVMFSEEDVNFGIPESSDFNKFISRIKKYSPKENDVLAVYVDPDTPAEAVKRLINNLELFSKETKVHFIVLPSNLDVENITDRLSDEIKNNLKSLVSG